MKGTELFHRIEEKIPLEKALKGDKVGYIGSIDPDMIEINSILVIMDYIPEKMTGYHSYSDFDLMILHHPPKSEPPIPSYVIHSNWDIIEGGANDTLAESLGITPLEVFDEETGVGRIGKINAGPVPLVRFVREIKINLKVDDIRIVNCNSFKPVERIGLVSGFGLNPEMIQKAIDKGVDAFVSGDLTHNGAIIGKNAGITLIDATHYATEFPGLCKLGNIISSFGPDVVVRSDTLPWVPLLKNQVKL